MEGKFVLQNFYEKFDTKNGALVFKPNIGYVVVMEMMNYMEKNPRKNDYFYKYGNHFCTGTNLELVLGMAKIKIKQQFKISSDPFKNYLALAYMIVCNEDPSCEKDLQAYARSAIEIATDHINKTKDFINNPIFMIYNDVCVIEY